MGTAGSNGFYADYQRADADAPAPTKKGAVLDYNEFVEFVSEATVAELKAFVDAGEFTVEEIVEAEKKGKERKSVLALADEKADQ